MEESLLPIGSVVLLKESTKRVMIMGVLQKQTTQESKDIIWDYSGVYYPEGYMGPDRTFLFDNEHIERIISLGYQDEEQLAFSAKIDSIRQEIANSQNQE